MTLAMRHTGIVVRDLDAALSFYSDLLGFVETDRVDESGAYLDNILEVEDAQVTTVKLHAPGGGGLELLEVRAPRQKGAATPTRSTTRPGISHVALTVSVLEALYHSMNGAGVRFNAPPQLSPDGKVKLTYCRDPEGNFVELVEVLKSVPVQASGFAHAADPDYFDLLMKRLNEEAPELTFLAQFRDLLGEDLKAGLTLLDVGCATGYAHRSFRDLGVRYVGIDIEQSYLDAAHNYFSDDSRAAFAYHDILAAPYNEACDIVICDAVLEHLPGLEPGLSNLAKSCRNTLLLRTFLGPSEEIYDRAAPNPIFQDSHRKFSNQYAVTEVGERLEQLGFTTEIVRDRYTESLPRVVDGVFRTFYVVLARRR